MPVLNSEKRERFAVLVACERATFTDAYRAVYNCAGRTQEQVSKAASSLAAAQEIKDRILELQGRAADDAARKAAYTLADAIAEAESLRALAEERGHTAAAITAATLKAKLAGHLIERKEIKTGPLEDSDVEDLEALLAELKRRKAERAGGQVEQDDGNRPDVRAH